MKYMFPLQVLLLVLWFAVFPAVSTWVIFLPSILIGVYLVIVMIATITIAVTVSRG